MSSTIPHRYVTPTYPGAAGFDLFNVISGGQGASGSAFMDNAKIGGPNTGTYAVAFGEDATSNFANRGLRALAQNCDYLDNILHRLIAVPIRTSAVTAGSPVGSVTLPVATFLGLAGVPSTAAGYNLLFEITDANDDEIIDPGTGTKVQVSAVTLGTGDQIGGGGANGNFSGHTVGLTISPSIPTGVTYRVYYGTQGDLADLPLDAFTTIKVRGAAEIDATAENLFRMLHGNNESWNADWDSTIWDLASSGINERYNRSTTGYPGSPPEAYFPTTALNGYGSGSWFLRFGPALTGYTGNIGAYLDPMNAVFAAKFVDRAPVGSGGATGYVAFGTRQTGSAFTGETIYTPGAATFMSVWPHYFQNTIHATNPYTRILDGATANFAATTSFNLDTGEATVQVTQSGNYFRTGGGLSAVSLGYDLLQCTYTVSSVPTTRTFVIVAMGSTTNPSDVTQVRVRNLDGTVPNFTGGFTGTIRWMSLSFGLGDGAGQMHSIANTDVSPVLFDGLFYQTPPNLSAGSDDNVPRTPGSFSAMDTTLATRALQWGGFQRTQPSGPVMPSYLRGDGGIAAAGDVIASGSSNTVGAVEGNYVIINGNGPFGNVTNGNPALPFNCAIGSTGGCRLVGSFTNPVLVNITNVRTRGLYVMAIDHTSLTSSVFLDWTNGSTATVTSRFSPGDDQLFPGTGRTMWVGMAFSPNEIWWTVTRY